MKAPRLMLVEFLGDDPLRRFRSEEFPFILGYVRDLGIEALWTWYGTRDAHPVSEFVVEPPDTDREKIVEAVRGFAPTCLITNEPAGPGLKSGLRALPGLDRFVSIQEDVAHYALLDAATLSDWLGLPPEPGRGGPVYDLAAPDYDCHAVGAGPPVSFPLLTIVGGSPCLYRHPIRKNPFFEGVDLEGANRLEGCSFCLGNGNEDVWAGFRSSPVDLALAQIDRFRETAPAERKTDRYRLYAYEVFGRIDEFLDGVMDRGLPPSEFHFACRPNEFLTRDKVIEGWLPVLSEAGHSIHIWNMGIENFSPSENSRLNKGLDPGQVSRAVKRLANLEAAWPGTFVFSEHGGLSMIMFTPWTTLDDLSVNVSEARRLDVAPVFLRSRLQLRPGTPITLLAERDGLTAREFDQPSPLDFSCQCYPDEVDLPWRFLHPEVAAAYRFMLRMTPDSRIPADDPLRGKLDGMVRRLPGRGPHCTLALEALIDVLKDGNLPRDDDSVCDALERELRDRLEGGGPGVSSGLLQRFEAFVEPVLVGGPHALAEYQVAAVSPCSDVDAAGGVSVELVRGRDRLTVTILADDPGEPAAVRGGGLRLIYPESQAMDDPARLRLLGTLGKLLERYGERLL